MKLRLRVAGFCQQDDIGDNQFPVMWNQATERMFIVFVSRYGQHVDHEERKLRAHDKDYAFFPAIVDSDLI